VHRITIKFRDNTKDEVIYEEDYTKAYQIANKWWGPNIKSVHLKEIKR